MAYSARINLININKLEKYTGAFIENIYTQATNGQIKKKKIGRVKHFT